MTTTDLSSVQDKRREIALLTEKINRLRAKPIPGAVSDTVQGSLIEPPYTKHSIQITGVDVRTMDRTKQRIRKWRDRVKALEAEVNEVEDFIDDIDSSLIRQIVELRYIKGYTWNAVANRVYGYPNGNRARMKLERYLEKI